MGAFIRGSSEPEEDDNNSEEWMIRRPRSELAGPLVKMMCCPSEESYALPVPSVRTGAELGQSSR